MFHCNLITIVNALASNRDKTSLGSLRSWRRTTDYVWNSFSCMYANTKCLSQQIYPKYVLCAWLCVRQVSSFNFHHFFIKILSNLQRCVVSFGAMLLILFYNTRIWFLRCSQGRYGESMLWGYVNFVCLCMLKQCENKLSTVLRTRCSLSAS
jgi:hypothetical protein